MFVTETYVITKSYWTPCGLVTPYSIIKLCLIWSRQKLVTCLLPSHYLNQCWLIVNWNLMNKLKSWRHYQMETFSVLLAICVGNSPGIGEFPAQRLVTRNLDDFFDLHLNKWLSKQGWGWWFEMPSHQLWRHCNGNSNQNTKILIPQN